MNPEKSRFSYRCKILWTLLFVLFCGVPLKASFYEIEKVSLEPFGRWSKILRVNVQAQQDVSSKDTHLNAYFYDANRKLVASVTNPPAVPVIYEHGMPMTVSFALPRGWDTTNGQILVVFGDTNEVVAETLPRAGEAKLFDFPEKSIFENPPKGAVAHKTTVNPSIEYVAKSDAVHPKHPQVTLFLRMPKGVSDPAELRGVLVACVLWTGVDEARREMQLPEMGGDYKGIFNYANEHKLAIIAWGGPGCCWDPSKNYDAMDAKAKQAMEAELDEVSDTWEKGVKELAKLYHLPTKDYLLWGVCSSAQWAQRLCIRKPDYFLGCYLLIPGSFDKPTPEGSKVIWCLCTGELYGGYENSLKWYKECQALNYPMIYKAYEGLGHTSRNQKVLSMAFRFFDFVLPLKADRDRYDQATAAASRAGGVPATPPKGPWPEVFRYPLYYGDIVNQEVYPADQVEMIPPGFRTPLPTKAFADFWLHGQ